MGLVDKRPRKPAAQELFKAYSDEEKALLAKKYTPEQIRAIEAGEGAVPAEDLDRQGVIRTDIGSLPYLDDFSHYRGVVDKKPPDNTPVDPNARFMTPDELAKSFSDYYEKLAEENPSPEPNYDAEELLGEPLEAPEFDPTRLNFLRADYDSPRYMGANGPVPSGPNLLAPAIPKKISVDGTSAIAENGDVVEDPPEAEVDPRDPNGIYNRLRKQTGLSLMDIRNLNTKILVRHYVAKQTRLGRVRSLYCLAIAGNKNGMLGIGQAKGQEQENTMNLAKMAAIRNMKPIPRYEDRTIYGDVDAKVSGVVVKLMARSPGKSNLIASCSAKTHGS
jgi:small subunit ribosomal protein S5